MTRTIEYVIGEEFPGEFRNVDPKTGAPKYQQWFPKKGKSCFTVMGGFLMTRKFSTLQKAIDAVEYDRKNAEQFYGYNTIVRLPS